MEPQNTTNQMLIPVEVKENWAPIVTQTTTYACCPFSASPSRRFSASSPRTSAHLCPTPFPGVPPQWPSPNDAGFLESFDDFEMSLLHHEGGGTGTVARVTKVLQGELDVRGRGSRVLFMDYSADKGKKPESCNSALIPNVRTCEPPEGGAQTKQGNNEPRMSPHPLTAHRRL